MKNLIAAISIFSLIIFSAGAALFGAGSIIYNLFLGANIFTGFVIFSLGLILFSGIMSVYMLSKLITSNSILVESVQILIDNAIEKHIAPKNNPLQSLLNNLAGVNGVGNISSISIAKLDENGNIQSIGDKSISGLEEVMKNLNMNPFGEKKLEDIRNAEINCH